MKIKLTKLSDGFNEKVLRAPQLNRFPNVTAAGSYDYLSQVILLNSIKKRDLDMLAKCAGQDDYKYFDGLRKILPLLAHEQTHWIDSTSTLWGLKFIVSCYENFYDLGDESSFYKKKWLYNEIIKIKYPKYYTTKFPVDSKRPWKYEASRGWLFDKDGKLSNYPIFFTNFFNVNGERIAREPFTLCSLFEVSATAQEMVFEIGLMEKFLTEDQKLIEISQFERRVVSRLYDLNLTEYSVAAHKLSNSILISDALDAYKMSAILAHFCFNFPEPRFSKIDLDNSYDVDDPTLDGMKLAFNNYDRAALFYYLTDMLNLKSKEIGISSENIETIIMDIFKEMGIDLVIVEEEVVKELESIVEQSADSFDDDYISNLLRSGVKRFKKLGLFGSGLYPFKELNAPGGVLSDNYYYDPYDYPDKDIEARFNKFSSFYNALEIFSAACI